MNSAAALRGGGAFVGALALSLALTPATRRLALHWQILDRPDGKAKRHTEPVPYLGGLAVFVAFALSVVLVTDLDGRLPILLTAALAMALVGLFDDLRPLVWWQKLVAQVLVCAAAGAAGLQLQIDLTAPWRQILSLAWLLAATNALNMIDVADGLAGGVALTEALALAWLSTLLGEPSAALACLALGGACAGFVPLNCAPARLYLGDAGSLFIGFTLAGLAMLGDYTGQAPLTMLAPVGILVVPFFDTLLVASARLARGGSPFHGSADHFALRLRAHGWSAQAIACSGTAVSGAFGALALIQLNASPKSAALTAVAALALLLGLFVWLWRHSPDLGSTDGY